MTAARDAAPRHHVTQRVYSMLRPMHRALVCQSQVERDRDIKARKTQEAIAALDKELAEGDDDDDSDDDDELEDDDDDDSRKSAAKGGRKAPTAKERRAAAVKEKQVRTPTLTAALSTLCSALMCHAPRTLRAAARLAQVAAKKKKAPASTNGAPGTRKRGAASRGAAAKPQSDHRRRTAAAPDGAAVVPNGTDPKTGATAKRKRADGATATCKRVADSNGDAEDEAPKEAPQVPSPLPTPRHPSPPT